MSEVSIQKKSKSKKRSFLLFAAIIALIGCVVLFQSRAAVPTAPTVYMTPETTTLAANTTFNVTVRENSGTSPVNYTSASFSYPTNLVEFVAVDNPATSGSPFNAQAGFTNNNGTITIDRYINPPSASPIVPVSGDQFVATITFKTKTSNGAGLFSFVNGTELTGESGTNLITSLSRTQGASLTVDVLAPTVSVTGITNNQVISSGSTTPVTITTSDNTGAKTLEILIDGSKIATPTLSGNTYAYQWNTTGLSLGNHTFQVKAIDGYGNTGQSSIINVTVADKSAPTTSISAPSTNPLKGQVSLTATANDTGGGTVSKVEFYAGTRKIGEDTTSPYSVTWNTADGNYPDNTYSLTTKAYDNATPANVGTSPAVNVVVENTDKTKPTAPTNFRSTSTSATSVNLAWNASTDNVGVAGYRITRNGTTVQANNITGLTFNDTGLSAATTYNYSIVAVDTTGNLSDATTLSVTTPNRKIGDFNGDNSVSMQDLGLLLINWRTTNAQYDINKDGIVSGADLAMLLGNYGK